MMFTPLTSMVGTGGCCVRTIYTNKPRPPAHKKSRSPPEQNEIPITTVGSELLSRDLGNFKLKFSCTEQVPHFCHEISAA